VDVVAFAFNALIAADARLRIFHQLEMAMNKMVSAVTAATLLLAAIIPNQAVAYVQYPYPPKPPPIFHGGGSSGAGAAAAGGFIGFVGFLAIYDLIRRTTCSGDFLGMGGPGFTEPIRPGMNVLPPQCKRPTVVRTRG
jgi:hypothetical protein